MGAVKEGFKEECWFLFGIKIRNFYVGYLKYHSKGGMGSVSFEWEDALKGKLIGFYHTHPCGDPYPSSTDDGTMKTWVKSEGKPMLCGIKSRGKQACFLYRRSTTDRSVFIAEKMKALLVGSLLISCRASKPEKRAI